MSELTPVQPRERLVTLDVLRGIALCGVLIGNMVLYSGLWADRAHDATTLDTIAEWFEMIFVSSKAQTLLTFMFGFGFAIQLIRAEERHEPVMGLYVRRLLALLVLGSLHVSLLWWGDVTWTYAIAGFGLLPFLRASNRTRVVVGLVLIFVPIIVTRIPVVFELCVTHFMTGAEYQAAAQRMVAAIRSPDHAGLSWEHIRYALVWEVAIYSWYFAWTLGRFLLGYVAGKLHWFDRNGADHLPVFRRMAIWGGGIGIVATAFEVLERVHVIPFFGWNLVAAFVQEVAFLAMTIAYIGIVMLLMQRATWRRILGILAPVGRMPLTTYYTQSLVCTFLYYGWGLGWSGKVGPADTLGLALAIFAVQIAIAHLWLRYFRFGPLEWVWRTVVYWKRQPMRI